MKSISKLALLALALHTTAAQAQSTPARTAAVKTTAAAPVKIYHVVHLWHASEQPGTQEQSDLATLRTAYKGKNVEVHSIRWTSREELVAMLHKFFEDVQTDPANEKSFKVNGSELTFNKKGTLLIADDHLVTSAENARAKSISDYLKGAVK
jgi:hypothetical protein